MPKHTLGDIDRHGKILATVRRIFERCVQLREELPLDLDGLDAELIEAAATAQTGILILDALAKYRGGLNSAQSQVYVEQIELRDQCLMALAIPNVYAPDVLN